MTSRDAARIAPPEHEALLRAAIHAARNRRDAVLDASHIVVAAMNEPWIVQALEHADVDFSRSDLLRAMDADLPKLATDAAGGELSVTSGWVLAIEMAEKVPGGPSGVDTALAAIGAPGRHVDFIGGGRWRMWKAIRAAAVRSKISAPMKARVRKARRRVTDSIREAFDRLTPDTVRSVKNGTFFHAGRQIGTAIGGLLKGPLIVLQWAILGPGIVVREGSRVVFGLVLRVRRRPPGSAADYGWGFRLTPLRRPITYARLVVLPYLVTVTVGVALLIPPYQALFSLGVSPAAGLASQLESLSSLSGRDLFFTLLISSTAWWFGVSCLVASVPPVGVLREARLCLARTGMRYLPSRAVVLALSVIASMARPFEWVLDKVDIPPFVASGFVHAMIVIPAVRGLI